MAQSMTESRALNWLAVVAAMAIVWLALPFAVAILLGALMAFTLAPLCDRLSQRLRPVVAALLLVIVSGAVVVGVVAGFVSLFVARIVDVANHLREELRPGTPLTRWATIITRWLGIRGNAIDAITTRLQAAAGEIAGRAAAIATVLATGTFSMLLGLFFALLTMYVVLRHWPRMVSTLARLSPLQPTHTRAFLAEFERAGRTTLAGTVITGLVQGLFAAIGYWVTGVPQAMFFGVATAIASLMPGIGTLLIWLPIGLYLFAVDRPVAAIVELAWCAVTVVGLSDYVIRPRLVGDEGIPALLVYLALFGGLEVFGLSGLLVGPIVMALAVATLRLYARELPGA